MASSTRPHSKLQRLLSRRRVVVLLVSLIATVLLLLTGQVPYRSRRSVTFPPHEQCLSRTQPFHGGDCQAIGDTRRPLWACDEHMRQAIVDFITVYDRRPVRNNKGGVLFDHAFALWYTMMAEQPKVVIESGAFKGLGTWIIRTALPRARIISLDPAPERRRLNGVEYLTGNLFTDFGDVDWAAMNVDPEQTLVFLDDHQSAFRRIFDENSHGFRRFIAEDNYDYLQGDNMSLKWVCERERKHLWRGSIRDNFGRNRSSQSWEQHLQLGDRMKSSLKTYYEFPPVAASAFTNQTRFDERHATPPIVTDRKFFDTHLAALGKQEFSMYTHFSFVELLPQS